MFTQTGACVSTVARGVMCMCSFFKQIFIEGIVLGLSDGADNQVPKVSRDNNIFM